MDSEWIMLAITTLLAAITLSTYGKLHDAEAEVRKLRWEIEEENQTRQNFDRESG
jgi:hypothetical protein